MRQFRPMVFQLALCMLVLGGCAPAGPALTKSALPPIRAGTVGRLLIDGPKAFINGQQVMQSGSYVYSGETVSTGPGTSVLLVLNDGGEVQLDQNTDPLFVEAFCLVMEMARGRAAVKNQACLRLRNKDPDVALSLRSFVHIESAPDAARVTVLQGSVTTERPSEATLGPNDEYVVRRGAGAEILKLTPEQAYATIAWTQNYFRQPAAQQPGGMSPGEAAVVGGVIAAIVKFIFDRDKDGPARRAPRLPPQTAGETQTPAQTQTPAPAQTQPPAQASPQTSTAPQTQGQTQDQAQGQTQGRTLPGLRPDIRRNPVSSDPRRDERNNQETPPLR